MLDLMARKPLPKAIETSVLVRSRRRCCICFGLDRNTELKSGQIAHLDKNSSNNSEENLAFLCFHHHDEFDSTSSQRKNFTIGEVKEFRDELNSTINKAFTQQVHFGEITTPPSDPYAGFYTRIGTSSDSAEITLTPLPDSVECIGRYFVSGNALYGADREYGPNLGFLEFIGAVLAPNEIIDSHVNRAGETCTTVIKFTGDGYLHINEDNCTYRYGHGVRFTGIYKRLTTI